MSAITARARACKAASPSMPVEARRAVGRAAVVGGLLVGVSEFDQLRLTPRSAQQFHPDRQSVRCEAAGDDDGGQARVGAQLAVGVSPITFALRRIVG